MTDAYVSAGYLATTKTYRCIADYRAGAFVDDELVGTVGIRLRNHTLLPTERLLETDPTRFERPVEITGLAVAPRFRNRTGGLVLFPLVKWVFEVCTRLLEASHFLVSVHPRHRDLYEGILGFEVAGCASGARSAAVVGVETPSVCMYLELETARQRLRPIFRGLPRERNPLYFFYEHRLAGLMLPTITTARQKVGHHRSMTQRTGQAADGLADHAG